MRYIQTFFVFFLAFSNLQAQQSFLDTPYRFNIASDFDMDGQPADRILSKVIPVPLKKPKPFLAAVLRYDSQEEGLLEHFAIRFSGDGLDFGEWIPIHGDGHFPDDTRRNRMTGQLIFAPATSHFFQVAILPKGKTDFAVKDLEVLFFAPGASKEWQEPKMISQNRTVCPIPNFQGRSDWCSTSECPFGASQSITNVTHLIVHHSAGSNTNNDWAAVVKSIWHYHVDVKGWDDIGYNWLIDPNGVLYQGRKDNVRGAHFSGHNTGTMGVCLLGNFHDASPMVGPKLTMLEKLERLLCWKAEKENINPLATKYHAASMLNLKTIAGHRDGGSTACPGDSMYIQLPNVRHVVDSLLNFVAISDINLEDKVSIFPTLAQNSITIKYLKGINEKLNVQLVSITGITLQDVDIQGDTVIDITNSPKGVLLVRVVGKNSTSVAMIIKK